MTADAAGGRTLTPARAVALCLASGGLYGLALPPSPAPALAWVALVPWLVALAGAPPGRALVLGLVWTTAATAAVAAWFPSMLESFFGASPWQAWAGFLGLAIVINGAACALFALWVSVVTRRRRVAPVWVATAFVAAEWLRANGIVANPYAMLGTSLVDTPFAQTADLFGAATLSFLVVLVNAAVAGVFVRAYRPSRSGGLLVAACLALAFGYGMLRAETRFEVGGPIAVAAIQPAIPRAWRDDPERQAENVAHQLSLSEASAREGRLLFWPEAAVHFYLREPSPERSRLLDAARASGFELVLGGPHYRLERSEPRYFASAFLVREGALAERYDKQRLVPFAESSPLPPGVGPEPRRRFASGSGPRLLESSQLTIGPFLCGEVLFPGVARALVAAGADVLVNPSNDDWFGHPRPAAHQLAVARLRAIENRRDLVRPTTNGISAVIDARGKILARSRSDGPEVLHAEVHASRTTTLASVLGEFPSIAAWIAAVLHLSRVQWWTRFALSRGRKPCSSNESESWPSPVWRWRGLY